ncbi:MAG TPA: NosD domain-containing protein [bacterium]
MKKVSIAIMLLSLVILPAISFATTYYVSELMGDDNNDGMSEATPFATIQKAADVMVAGDMVIVDFGEYHETIVPKNNGTADNPIVYMAKEQGEAEIFTGETAMLPTFTLHSGSIYVMEDVFRTVNKLSESGASLIKKDHLDSLVAASFFQDRMENKLYVWSSDNADPAAHADTVFFEMWSFDIIEGSHITIDAFKIKNGIRLDVGTNLVPLPGLVIQNNHFEGYAQDNYLLDTDPGVVTDIAISIDGGDANPVNTYENFLITKNVFIDYYSAIKILNAGRNSTISENTFDDIGLFDTNDWTIRLEGSSSFSGVQCDGLVIERNWFEVFGRSLYFTNGEIDGVTIRNNIAFKCGSLFAMLYNSTNVDIINNTIAFAGAEYAIRVRPESVARIYNNIFAYNTKRSIYDEDVGNPDTSRFDYNYYVADTVRYYKGHPHENYIDIKQIRTKNPDASTRPGGPHAVYGHPVFDFDSDGLPDSVDMTTPVFPLFADTTTGDLKLVVGSLAIDAGWADVAPEVDFFGIERDDKPDMGAIEFVSTGVAPNVSDLFPQEYQLSQNYPNPFNPETKIEFKLPKSGKIKLIVYNILGQKVATLFEGFKRAGIYSVKWNGLDLYGNAVPSGIYFYRLEAGSIIRTAKMTLVK